MTDQAKQDLPDLPQQSGIESEMTEISSPVPTESVGSQLARRRQELGWTVEHVASRLNLAPRQIDALESDNLAALPGLASTRGFVRAYAKLLRIEAAPLVSALTQDAGPQEEAIPLRRPISSTPFAPAKLAPMKRGMSSTWLWALLGVAVAAVAAAGAWQTGLLHKFGSDGSALPAASATASTAASVDSASAEGASVSSAAGAPAASVFGDNAATSAGQASALAGSASTQGAPGAPSTAAGSTAIPSNAAPSTGAASTGAASTGAPATGAASAASPSTALPATASQAAGGAVVAPATGAKSAAAAPASPAPTPAAAAAPATAAAPGKPAAAARALVVKVKQECWIEVKRGDKPVTTRTLPAGSTETIDVAGGVVVTVGNVHGVDLTLAGKPLDVRSRARNNVVRLELK